MMRAVAFSMLAMLFAGGAAPVVIDLPVNSAEFPVLGPGAPSPEAVNANCLACHSAEMVTNQPRLSAAEWTATVVKMRTAFKAPVDPGDDAAIIAWLAAWSAALPGDERAR